MMNLQKKEMKFIIRKPRICITEYLIACSCLMIKRGYKIIFQNDIF